MDTELEKNISKLSKDETEWVSAVKIIFVNGPEILLRNKHEMPSFGTRCQNLNYKVEF